MRDLLDSVVIGIIVTACFMVAIILLGLLLSVLSFEGMLLLLFLIVFTVLVWLINDYRAYQRYWGNSPEPKPEWLQEPKSMPDKDKVRHALKHGWEKSK